MNLALSAILKPTPIKMLALGSLLVGAALVAQSPEKPAPGSERPRPEGPRHDRGHEHGPFADLKLTDAQKASLKTIADKHKASFEARHKANQEAMQAFQKALQDPATKDADLKALHDKTSERRFAGLLEHRAMMQECLAVLTPEQKAQWEKKRAEHPHWGAGFGPGFGPGKGGPRHEGRGPRHDGQGPQHDGPQHDGMGPGNGSDF